jgi:hypothetical protein
VIPIRVKRRGVEAKLVISAVGSRPIAIDTKLISAIAEAHCWFSELAQGQAASLRDLARRSGRDAGEVSRTLPLAFLSPDLIEAILDGSQSPLLTTRQLKRIRTLPFRWREQHHRFGFHR